MNVCSHPTRGVREVSSTSQMSASKGESKIKLGELVISPSAAGERSSGSFLESSTASVGCRGVLMVENSEPMSKPSTLVLSLVPASPSPMLMLELTPRRRSESESIGSPSPLSPSPEWTCDCSPADPNVEFKEFRSSPRRPPGTPLIPNSCRANSICNPKSRSFTESVSSRFPALDGGVEGDGGFGRSLNWVA